MNGLGRLATSLYSFRYGFEQILSVIGDVRGLYYGRLVYVVKQILIVKAVVNACVAS